jgi:putative ABC transport system ATP-binding protein
MSILRLDRVSKSWGDISLLDQVSFEIEAGKCVAIMGRSGSGKSSLMNLIAGLTRPDSGTITFDGHSLTQLNESELTAMRGQKLGFLFQQFCLLESLTVLENVCLPLEILQKPHVIQTALLWLEKVGLKEKAADLPSTLSGGEKQRIALARALVHHPQLVLADEPTGNLDFKTSEHITHMMLEHTKNTNTTLLIATHDIDLAKKADYVVELYKGSLRRVDFS